MKAAFISALAAFAAAEATCEMNDKRFSSVLNVEKPGDCDHMLEQLKDDPDSEFTADGCHGMGCDGGCEISVCGDGQTLKQKDIIGAVEDLLETCGENPEGFQGKAPSGEVEVVVFMPRAC